MLFFVATYPLLSNPPHPEAAEMLEDLVAMLMDPASADGDDVFQHSQANADKSTSAGLGGDRLEDEDDDDVSLCVRRHRPSASIVQSTGGDGDAPSTAVLSTVPCPAPAAPKKQKFGVLVHPPAAPQGFVFCLFLDYFFSFLFEVQRI